MSTPGIALRPGEVIKARLAAGVLLVEVMHHDAELGLIIGRAAGIPGYLPVPRTAIAGIASADEAEAAGYDPTLRNGGHITDYEANPLDVIDAILAEHLDAVWQRMYRQWETGRSLSPAPRDLAREALAFTPDSNIVEGDLADFIYCLEEIALMPDELAQRVALVLVDDDPADALAREMGDR